MVPKIYIARSDRESFNSTNLFELIRSAPVYKSILLCKNCTENKLHRLIFLLSVPNSPAVRPGYYGAVRCLQRVHDASLPQPCRHTDGQGQRWWQRTL